MGKSSKRFPRAVPAFAMALSFSGCAAGEKPAASGGTWVQFLYASPGMAALLFIAAAIVVLTVLFHLLRRRHETEQQQLRAQFERITRAKERRLSEVLMHEYDYATTINLSTMDYTQEDMTEDAAYFPVPSSGDYRIAFVDFCMQGTCPEDIPVLQRVQSPEGLLRAYEKDHDRPLSSLFRFKNGAEEIWCEASIYFDEIDGVPYAYIFNKDVTERVLGEQALRQAQQERERQIADLEKMRDDLQLALASAEQANAAKGVFTSRMSHEIRTPLNAVIGYMTIAKSTKSQEKIHECIVKTDVAAKHLLRIINDVLDISSIESGRMKIASESFDFKQMISSLTDMYYLQAKEKGVAFEVLLNGVTEEWLVGDQLRLNQILINLLSNALKFTPAGGKVYLTITQVFIRDKTVYLCFSVRDTGIGMTQEFMQRLFTPFEQQDAKIAKNYGGTGLGLSICKNLVTMMSGSITVQSEEGKGSTFSVELPFALDENAQHHIDALSCDFSRTHALVVDDEQDACEYMSLLMQRCGVRSEAVQHGSEAVSALTAAYRRGDPFDLCLIDWKMPGMDGVETVRQLRGCEGGGLPIIIVSAYDFSEIEPQARAAGVDQFVSKPLFQSTVFNLLVNTYGTYDPRATAAASSYDFTGMRLLLAEDNEINMEIAAEILQEAGFTVDGAVNGREAADRFLASPLGTYQAILMDVMMPVLDGYAATRLIRRADHPEAATIPIIAMTANAFTEDVSDALAAGMNDHIAKPIDLKQMFSTLDKYLTDRAVHRVKSV